MTTQECARLLMWCGALHDIREQTYDNLTRIRLEEVEQKIEDLIMNSGITIINSLKNKTT